MTAYFFKTQFNHDPDAESLRTGLRCKDPSKAQQHMAEEADINTIVKRFGVTGLLPQVPMPPLIDEFADIFDFQSAMNLIQAAKHSFSQLPAEVRTLFGNDPHSFVSYVDAAVEARDFDQLRKWGLAPPEPPPAVLPQSPTPPPAEPVP